MEELHINMEGTMNQRYPNILQSIDDCVSRYPNILQSIIKYKQDKYPKLPPFNRGCHIYRVHEGLRKVKPEAYEPMVVSIGPYHLQNSKLEAMKEHKLWYLHSLLERINMRVETCILELDRLVDKVGGCYDKPIHLNREKFVEMMLLDGCFIIEFFRKKTANPKLAVDWMENRIIDDMMLLENQLPFFLLSDLYDMTKRNDDPEEPLMSLIANSLADRIPLPHVKMRSSSASGNHAFTSSRNLDDHPGIMHLLHLVHALCRPLPSNRLTLLERNIKKKIKDFVLCPVHFLSKPLLMLIRSQIDTRDDIRNQMHSAVELQEAGVKFKKVDANLFDIRFKDGLMELPCFSVEDSTDTFFRNLIAFEQQSKDVPRYFTDFMDFMDQLINSEKDVKLLRHKGIIQNLLGDDTEVSNLFNKLGDGVTVSSCDSYLSNESMEVNKHCGKTWNKMRAKLMRDYFNSPWATVSTIAAATLLLLTLLQTIASVKTL